MKFLSLFLLTALAFNPLKFCLDSDSGFLVEDDKILAVKIKSDGENYKQNITIEIENGDETIILKPIANSGYNPNVFIANFLDNGFEQLLYSVESGGSGGYSFYELYSLNDGTQLLFNSQDFNPTITAKEYNENIIELNYQGQKLYLDSSMSKCDQVTSDCSIEVVSVNTILPFYNIALDRYYLQVLQPVYQGYRANNLGYVSTILQINEDGYDTINIGILKNFEYKR